MRRKEVGGGREWSSGDSAVFCLLLLAIYLSRSFFFSITFAATPTSSRRQKEDANLTVNDSIAAEEPRGRSAKGSTKDGR